MFLNNARLFLREREKIFNNFKSKIFPKKNLDKILTSEPTPDPTPNPSVFDAAKPTKAQAKKSKKKHKISPLNLCENFMNEIENDKKNINNEIFMEYFNHHNPSFLIEDLHKANQAKNQQTINKVNNALIGLRSDVNKKTIPENGNPDEIFDLKHQLLNK